jgi:hypothetical protein
MGKSKSVRSILKSLAAGIAFAAATSASALVIPLGQVILNGGFETGGGSLANWTPSGSANPRGPGNIINTATGNAGFNSFFTSNFAAVGSAPNAGIGGNPNQGVSQIAQSFFLPDVINGRDVIDYTLQIVYTTVFDGRDNMPLANDIFAVVLTGTTLLTNTPSNNLPTCGPTTQPACPNQQIETNFSTSLVNVAAGTHTLRFTLSELSGPQTNTSAGIDNVSILAFATVLVDEPAILGLLAVGAFPLFAASRRRKAVARTPRERPQES